MDITNMQANVNILNAEMQWLALVIDTRMKLYWGKECDYHAVSEVPMPDIQPGQSVYSDIVLRNNLNFEERIILALSLAPHLQPHLLDVFFVKNADFDRGFTEFGGIKGKNHAGFLPTGETAAFILAANDLEMRFKVMEILGSDHFFHQLNIVQLHFSKTGEPFLSGVLKLSFEYLSYFIQNSEQKPDFNIHFPAKLITTSLDWDDLILDENVMEEIQEINDWLEYGDQLLNNWGMPKPIKPGYRILFYGPPGTGKTLTAALIGKSKQRDVYRIDLSMVVSKYIGETEKNLANIFDQAQNKNWVLFFDEADSLFGKRTANSSSNDRYANQELSYLLQRIEDFPGLLIFATDIKANIDDAFMRRFQSVIAFQIPTPEQREKLWNKAFSKKMILGTDIDIKMISEKYELSGGGIINVVMGCSLMALKRGNNTVLLSDLLKGIRREFAKEGKITATE